MNHVQLAQAFAPTEGLTPIAAHDGLVGSRAGKAFIGPIQGDGYRVLVVAHENGSVMTQLFDAAEVSVWKLLDEYTERRVGSAA